MQFRAKAWHTGNIVHAWHIWAYVAAPATSTYGRLYNVLHEGTCTDGSQLLSILIDWCVSCMPVLPAHAIRAVSDPACMHGSSILMRGRPATIDRYGI